MNAEDLVTKLRERAALESGMMSPSAALMRQAADVLAAAPSAEQKVGEVERVVCEEIKRIMQTYREQEAERGYVYTPGGLEHMGDVWRLLSEWDNKLRAALPAPPTASER